MRKQQSLAYRHWPCFDEEDVEKRERVEISPKSQLPVSPLIYGTPPAAESPRRISLRFKRSGASRCIEERGILEFLTPSRPNLTPPELQSLMGEGELHNMPRLRQALEARDFCEDTWETLTNALVYLRNPAPIAAAFSLETDEMGHPEKSLEDYMFLALYLTSFQPASAGANSTVVLIRLGVVQLIERGLAFVSLQQCTHYPSVLMRLCVSLYAVVARQKKADLTPNAVRLLADIFPNMRPRFRPGHRQSDVDMPCLQDLHGAAVVCLVHSGRDPTLLADTAITSHGAARLVGLLLDPGSDGVILYHSVALATLLVQTSYSNAAVLVAAGLKEAIIQALTSRSGRITTGQRMQVQTCFWATLYHATHMVLSPADLLRQDAAGLPLLSQILRVAARVLKVQDPLSKEEQRGMILVLAMVQKAVHGSRACAELVAHEGVDVLLDVLLCVELPPQVLVTAAMSLEYLAEYPDLAHCISGGADGKLSRAVMLSTDVVLVRLVAAVAMSHNGLAAWPSLPLEDLVGRMGDYIQAQDYPAADALAQALNSVYRSGLMEVPLTRGAVSQVSKHSVHSLWLRQYHAEAGWGGEDGEGHMAASGSAVLLPPLVSWWQPWFHLTTSLLVLEVECEEAVCCVTFECLSGAESLFSKWRKEAVMLRDRRQRELLMLQRRIVSNPTLPDDVLQRQQKELAAVPERFATGLQEAQVLEERWCVMMHHVSSADTDLFADMQMQVQKLQLEVEHIISLPGYVSGGAAALNASYFLYVRAGGLAEQLQALQQTQLGDRRDIDSLLKERRALLSSYLEFEAEQGPYDAVPVWVANPELSLGCSPFLAAAKWLGEQRSACSYDVTLDVGPLNDMIAGSYQQSVCDPMLRLVSGEADPLDFTRPFFLRTVFMPARLLHNMTHTVLNVGLGLALEGTRLEGADYTKRVRLESLSHRNVMLSIVFVYHNTYFTMQRDQSRHLAMLQAATADTLTPCTAQQQAEEDERLGIVTEWAAALSTLVTEGPANAASAVQDSRHAAVQSYVSTLPQVLQGALPLPDSTPGAPTCSEEQAHLELAHAFCEELQGMCDEWCKEATTIRVHAFPCLAPHVRRIRGGVARTVRLREGSAKLDLQEATARLREMEDAAHEWCCEVFAAYCGLADLQVESQHGNGPATVARAAATPAHSWAALPQDADSLRFDFSSTFRNILQLDDALQGMETELFALALEEAAQRWKLENESAQEYHFNLEMWGVEELYRFELDELAVQHVSQRKQVLQEEAVQYSLVLSYAAQSKYQTLHHVSIEGMRTRERGAVLELKKRIDKERSDIIFTHEVELRRKGHDPSIVSKQSMQRTFAEIKWADELERLAEKFHNERMAHTNQTAAVVAKLMADSSKQELLVEQQIKHIHLLRARSTEMSSARISHFTTTRTELASCTHSSLQLWTTMVPANQSAALHAVAEMRSLCALKSTTLKRHDEYDISLFQERCAYEHDCLVAQLSEDSNCVKYIDVSSRSTLTQPPTPVHLACQELLTGTRVEAIRKSLDEVHRSAVFDAAAERWERAVWAVNIPFHPVELPLVDERFAPPGTDSADNVRAFMRNLHDEFRPPTTWDEWQQLLQVVMCDAEGRSHLDPHAQRPCEALLGDITQEHLQSGEAWLHAYDEDIQIRRKIVNEMELDVQKQGIYVAGKERVAQVHTLKKNLVDDERYLNSLWRYYVQTVNAVAALANDALFYSYMRQQLERVVELGIVTYKAEVSRGPTLASAAPTTQDAEGKDETSILLHQAQIGTMKWVVSFEAAVATLFEAEMRMSFFAKRCTYFVQKLHVMRNTLRVFAGRLKDHITDTLVETNLRVAAELKQTVSDEFAPIAEDTLAQYARAVDATRTQRLENLIALMREAAEESLKGEVNAALNSYIEAQWIATTEFTISTKRTKNNAVVHLVRQQLQRTTSKAFARQSIHQQASELALMKQTLDDLIEKNPVGSIQLPPLPNFINVMRYVPRRAYEYLTMQQQSLNEEQKVVAKDLAESVKVLHLMSYLPKQPPSVEEVLGMSLGKWGSVLLDYKAMLSIVSKGSLSNATLRSEFERFIGEIVLRHNVHFLKWKPVDQTRSDATDVIQKQRVVPPSAARKRDQRVLLLTRIKKLSDAPMCLEALPPVQKTMTLSFMHKIREFYISRLHTCNVTGSIEEFETEWDLWCTLVQTSIKWAVYANNPLPGNPVDWNLPRPEEEYRLQNKVLVPLMRYAAAVNASCLICRDEQTVTAMKRDVRMIMRGRLAMGGCSTDSLFAAQCVARLCFEQQFYFKLRDMYDAWSKMSRNDSLVSIEAHKEFYKQCYTYFIEMEGERDLLVTQQKADRTVRMFAKLCPTQADHEEPLVTSASRITAKCSDPLRTFRMIETLNVAISSEILLRRELEVEEVVEWRNTVLDGWEAEITRRKRELLCNELVGRTEVMTKQACAYSEVLQQHVRRLVKRKQLKRHTLQSLHTFSDTAARYYESLRVVETENLLNEEGGEQGWRSAYYSSVYGRSLETQDEFFKDWVLSRSTRYILNLKDVHCADPGDALLDEVRAVVSPASLSLELSLSYLFWEETQARLAVEAGVMEAAEEASRELVTGTWHYTLHVLYDGMAFVEHELQKLAEDMQLVDDSVGIKIPSAAAIPQSRGEQFYSLMKRWKVSLRTLERDIDGGDRPLPQQVAGLLGPPAVCSGGAGPVSAVAAVVPHSGAAVDIVSHPNFKVFLEHCRVDSEMAGRRRATEASSTQDLATSLIVHEYVAHFSDALDHLRGLTAPMQLLQALSQYPFFHCMLRERGAIEAEYHKRCALLLSRDMLKVAEEDQREMMMAPAYENLSYVEKDAVLRSFAAQRVVHYAAKPDVATMSESPRAPRSPRSPRTPRGLVASTSRRMLSSCSRTSRHSFARAPSRKGSYVAAGLEELSVLFNPGHGARKVSFEFEVFAEDERAEANDTFFDYLDTVWYDIERYVCEERSAAAAEPLVVRSPFFPLCSDGVDFATTIPGGYLDAQETQERCALHDQALAEYELLREQESRAAHTASCMHVLRDMWGQWRATWEAEHAFCQEHDELVAAATASLEMTQAQQHQQSQEEIYALMEDNKERGDLTCIIEHQVDEEECMAELCSDSDTHLAQMVQQHAAQRAEELAKFADTRRELEAKVLSLRTLHVETIRTREPKSAADWHDDFEAAEARLMSQYSTGHTTEEDEALARYAVEMEWWKGAHSIVVPVPGVWLRAATRSLSIASTHRIAMEEQYALKAHAALGGSLYNVSEALKANSTAEVEWGMAALDKAYTSDVAKHGEKQDTDTFNRLRGLNQKLDAEVRIIAEIIAARPVLREVRAPASEGVHPQHTHLWMWREVHLWRSVVAQEDTPPLLMRRNDFFMRSAPETLPSPAEQEEATERIVLTLHESIAVRPMLMQHCGLTEATTRTALISEEEHVRLLLFTDFTLGLGYMLVTDLVLRTGDTDTMRLWYDTSDSDVSSVCSDSVVAASGVTTLGDSGSGVHDPPLFRLMERLEVSTLLLHIIRHPTMSGVRNSSSLFALLSLLDRASTCDNGCRPSRKLLEERCVGERERLEGLLLLHSAVHRAAIDIIVEERVVRSKVFGERRRALSAPAAGRADGYSVTQGEDVSEFIATFLSELSLQHKGLDLTASSLQQITNVHAAVTGKAVTAMHRMVSLLHGRLPPLPLRVPHTDSVVVLEKQHSVEGRRLWALRLRFQDNEAFERMVVETMEYNLSDAYMWHAKWLCKAVDFEQHLACSKATIRQLLSEIHTQRWRMTVASLLKQRVTNARELRSAEEYTRHRVVEMKDMLGELRGIEVHADLAHRAAEQLARRGALNPEEHAVLVPASRASQKAHLMLGEEHLSRVLTVCTEVVVRERILRLAFVNQSATEFVTAHNIESKRLYAQFELQVPRASLQAAVLRLRATRPKFDIRPTLGESTDLALRHEQRTRQAQLLGQEQRQFSELLGRELSERHIMVCTDAKLGMAQHDNAIQKSIFACRGLFLETQLLVLQAELDRAVLYSISELFTTEVVTWRLLKQGFVEGVRKVYQAKLAALGDSCMSVRHSLLMKQAKVRNGFLNAFKQIMSAADVSGSLYITVVPHDGYHDHDLLRVPQASGIADLKLLMQQRYPTVSSLPLTFIVRGSPIPSYHSCSKYVNEVLHVSLQPHRKCAPLPRLGHQAASHLPPLADVPMSSLCPLPLL